MKFKVGDKIRIKEFKKRPGYWNDEGKMDHLMGKVVSIMKALRKGYEVYDEVHKRSWYIKENDFEPVNETIVIYRKDLKVIALDKSTGKKAIARCCPEDTFDFETGAKLAFERLTAEPLPKTIKQDSYEVGDKVLIKSWDQMAKEYSVDGVGDIRCKCCFVKSMEKYCEKVVTIEKITSDRNYNISEDHEKWIFSNDMIAGKVVEDTAEEPKKQLYNGKIIFTKGDEIFKTGHIYEIKDGRIKTDHCTYPLDKPFKDIDDVEDYFTADAKGRNGYGWSCKTLKLIEVQDD